MDIHNWTYADNAIKSECVLRWGQWPVLCHPSVLDPQPVHCTEIQPQWHSIFPKAEPLSWPWNDSSLWMPTTQAPLGRAHRAGDEEAEQSSPIVPCMINWDSNLSFSLYLSIFEKHWAICLPSDSIAYNISSLRDCIWREIEKTNKTTNGAFNALIHSVFIDCELHIRHAASYCQLIFFIWADTKCEAESCQLSIRLTLGVSIL